MNLISVSKMVVKLLNVRIAEVGLKKVYLLFTSSETQVGVSWGYCFKTKPLKLIIRFCMLRFGQLNKARVG